ncbi:uncharacterized protein [Chelonus insularis]|uniref:uncharacterized protein n=1 Tax=Chelonus insularis TaxID=460826 RepID=UPI00158B0C60|nr:uncharacterized protein LOC118064028 [Chelonus insularis]XP_034934268.1 uncharacterized protein LOC118064028 [Chelonus insularis]
MCDPASAAIHLPMNTDDDVDEPISCSDNDVLFQNKQNKVNSLHSTEYYKITYNTDRKSNLLSKKNINDQAAVHELDSTHNSNMRSSKDHNYSDTLKYEKTENISYKIKKEYSSQSGVIGKNISSSSSLKTNKSLFEIKNINDLKKVLPKVKLLNDQIDTLNDLSKTHMSKPVNNFMTSEVTNQKYKLKDYCRTCAGLKIPLVDIFSEKGIQMRLSQQMKHLENIEEHDNLSTQMCMDCICDLKMSYKFFMQIKKAQVKLKSIYESSNLQLSSNAEYRSTTQSLKFNHSEKTFLRNNDNLNVYSERTNENESLSSLKNNNDSIQIENKKQLKQLYEVSQNNSGYDSIEEFDPDDTLIQTETIESDTLAIDNDDIKNPKCDKVVYIKENSCSLETSKRSNEFDTSTGDTTIYQYDTELDTYIKLNSFEGVSKMKNVYEVDSSQLFSVSSEMPKNTENFQTVNNEIKEISKHPSILKRKILVCDKPTNSMNINQHDNELQVINKEAKIHKLNTLNVSPSDEQGIMYVTVKGSKPNELLLVKVKKMDKADEKKDDNNLHKKVTDTKIIDKTCGFKNIIFKDKYNIRSKELENRGAIIEEQIEEYKKKREKILGGISNSSSSDINNTCVEPKSYENQQSQILDSNKITLHNEEWELLENINDQSDNDILYLDNNLNTTEKIEQNITEKYLGSSVLNQKLDQMKNKKLICQKVVDESTNSDNSIEKLSRLLGEREKNLQHFQDYLKQRKIIINKLKDNDILSLYENSTFNDIESSNATTISQNAILDFRNEVDSTQESIFDCDYCLNTFKTRETLEEHFKIHDYKLFYFCEDCNSEFLTNKAKRSHSITCLKKLICNYCNLMLESKGKKRQHEQKHCDAIYGQLCDVCGEKFKHQGTLDQHIKTQHMSWEKIFQCPKCPKKFAFKQKLTFHVKSVHTTLRAYLCEDCGADFKNPASLRHHRIRKHQPTSNKRECQVCHKLVPFYSLSKHMYTHKAYTIKCPHCDKMFKNSSTLKQHLRIHEDQRQYRCDTCGVGFNRRDGLRLHMRVHQKSDSRALKECSCQICSEKFPNHSMLVIHRNRVHKDGKQYTCHICNRSMLSTRSLEWHMSHIHNEIPVGMADEQSDVIIEKKRVSCNHCNKTFKTEMILRTHIKNTHMEKNPVKCADCDLKFTSEVRLRHHMMIAHNRLEGTLTCPHCPKRFVNQLRLKTHMISHSEERPYTCEICGFNLKTKIQLIKHHQNRHSDERPLQCRYCPWRCKQVSALVCHERTHTNERPYSCIVCKQRFKYLGDKNKHERRHESLGGSGFKRIVAGRNIKNIRNSHHDVGETTSVSDQEQMDLQEGEYDTNTEADLTMERHYGIEANEEFENKYNVENQEIIKFEAEENIKEDYDHTTNYEQQEFEETSQDASEAADVIMSIEDTAVYTEEVTADNIEHAEMISNQILRTGTVVHLQQQDDTGKIQMIPVMLSLPDLTDDSTTEVNLSSASIVYDS